MAAPWDVIRPAKGDEDDSGGPFVLNEPKVNLGVEANCRWDEELSRGVKASGCRNGGGLEAGWGLSEGRNRREAGVYSAYEYIATDEEDRRTIGGGTMDAV